MPTKKPLSTYNHNVSAEKAQKSQAVDWEALLARIPGGKTVVLYDASNPIFRQGDPADSLFYLRRGKVKLSVTSEEGKEAIIAILDADEFFGEGCLAGQPSRMATATAVEASTLTRIAKPLMARMLHDEAGRRAIVCHPPALPQHPLRSGSRRSALQLQRTASGPDSPAAAHFGKESKMESVVPGITQEGLAQMIGTTRSRVNHLMNKFKKLGFISLQRRLDRQQRAAQRAVSARYV